MNSLVIFGAVKDTETLDGLLNLQIQKILKKFKMFLNHESIIFQNQKIHDGGWKNESGWCHKISGILNELVHHILHEYLCMQKLCTKLVPCSLTTDQ